MENNDSFWKEQGKRIDWINPYTKIKDVVYSKEILDQKRESPWGATQREQKQGLEFGEPEYDEIDRYCKSKNIDWFASAWDINSLNFLKKFNLK